MRPSAPWREASVSRRARKANPTESPGKSGSLLAPIVAKLPLRRRRASVDDPSERARSAATASRSSVPDWLLSDGTPAKSVGNRCSASVYRAVICAEVPATVARKAPLAVVFR
jgi:hypothetical protein